MAGQVNLEGNITAGPVSVGDLTAFPGGSDVVPLVTVPNPKSYDKHEHKTPNYGIVTDQALDFTGISATFFYLRSDKAITVKINGNTDTIPVYGILMIEAPSTAPITAATVTTTETTQLEYLVAGS